MALTHMSQPTLVPKWWGGSRHEEDGHNLFPFPLDMSYRDVYTALFYRMTEEDVEAATDYGQLYLAKSPGYTQK